MKINHLEHDIVEYLDEFTVAQTTLDGLYYIAEGNIEAVSRYIESSAFKDSYRQAVYDSDSAKLTYTIANSMSYGQALSHGVLSRDALEILLHYFTFQPESYEDAVSMIAEMLLAYAGAVRKAAQKEEGLPVVRKARYYIGENLYSSIRIREIADYCGISVSSLQHLFRKETGMNLKSYIRRQRIRKACEWLKGGKTSSLQAGARLGYCSQSYFAKDFKRETGMTPGEYMKYTAGTVPVYPSPGIRK